ncbi:MAG: very short patch repair endonuclease [Mycobacteriales bacterium]
MSTSKGHHLAGRSKTDTAPEVALRSALHGLGLRFRKNVTLARGCTPDILLPRHRLAVFVDGCFWHGCPEHGRKTPFTGPNAALWEEKMRRNCERDERATSVAVEAGWSVVRVWECEVMQGPCDMAQRVLAQSRAD